MVLSLIFSSCAIHKDFPFICLRWGCFAKQVGLPDSRLVKKRMEANAKVRRKKRENKRRKRKGYDNVVVKNEKHPEDGNNEIPPSKQDSLKYTFNTSGEENFLILVFKEAHPPEKDSMYIKYPGKEDGISNYEKQRIVSFIQQHYLSSGDKIIIKEYQEYHQHELRGASNKAKEMLIEFLETLGINRKQIRFKE